MKRILLLAAIIASAALLVGCEQSNTHTDQPGAASTNAPAGGSSGSGTGTSGGGSGGTTGGTGSSTTNR